MHEIIHYSPNYLSILVLNGLFQFRNMLDKAGEPGIKNKIYLHIEIAEVKIGNQIWMTQNLKVAYFRNGDSVPHAKTAEVEIIPTHRLFG